MYSTNTHQSQKPTMTKAILFKTFNYTLLFFTWIWINCKSIEFIEFNYNTFSCIVITTINEVNCDFLCNTSNVFCIQPLATLFTCCPREH